MEPLAQAPQVPPAPRAKFLNQLDWSTYLASGLKTGIDLYAVRKLCYKDIEQLRGRPLIVYASNFSSPLGQFASNYNGIVLDDVDGFTDLVSRIDAKITEIDILIHSPGGS